MARGRILAKSLSTSEKRAQLHDVAGPLAEFAMSLYPLLIAHADDFGREAGDLFTVKHRIDPASPRSLADFSAALSALDRVGLIAWYTAEVDGLLRRCIEIRNFDRYQTGLQRRTKSLFPAAPSVNFSEVHGTSVKFPEIPPRARAEQNRTEGKGTEEKGREGDRGVRATALVPVPTETADSAVPQTARDRQTDDDTRTAAENLAVITALFLNEILPIVGLPDSEYMEATKERCAALHIAYDSGTVRKAIDSALHIHALHKVDT